MSGADDKYTGAFGPESKRKADCPECKRLTRVDTLFERIEHWEDQYGSISGVIEHYVFECRGCETLFFAKSSNDSEDYAYFYDPELQEDVITYLHRKAVWPSIPATQKPSWVGFNLSSKDEVLYDLLSSVYLAMNADLRVLAAIGMRTTLDRASELLGVSTELSFEDKLEEMRKAGFISGVQKGVLTVLISAGSAAAHRGWKPDSGQLETMKDILESLIKDHFVRKGEVEELKASIPQKTQ